MTTSTNVLPAAPRSTEELSTITVSQWQTILAAEARDPAAWLEAAAQLGHAEAQAILGQWRLDCYRRGAEGGDFRGQFCYAGMLAARGLDAEVLDWLAKVTQTATPGYLRQAGKLVLQSPQRRLREVAAHMLARAGSEHHDETA